MAIHPTAKIPAVKHNHWGARHRPGQPLKADPVPDLIAESAREAATIPKLLTPAEVAQVLGVGVRTLERWRMTGEGPEFLKLSRKQVRYTEDALANFIKDAARRSTAG